MRFTIRKKLLVSFILVIALLITTSTIAIVKMEGMGKKTEEIDQNRMPSIVLLGGLNGDFSDLQRLLLKYTLETNKSEMDRLQSRINETEVSINKRIEKYEPLILSEDGRLIFNSFEENYKAYVEKLPTIMEAASKNNFSKANILQLEAHPLWQEADASIDKLIERNEKAASAASAQSVKLFKTGVFFVLVLSIVATIVGIVVALVISRMISNPLIKMGRSAEQIAAGDLSANDIDIKNRDELGDLAKSFNTMSRNLRTLIQEVGSTAEQVASSAEELTASAEQTSTATQQVANNMQEVAKGVEKQVQSVEESSQTINKMSLGAQQIASNAQDVSDTAIEASQKASEGRMVINAAIQQMNSINETVNGLGRVIKGLGEHSNEIGKIIGVITGIADQTNLLALNAAIEAARAGEHGRGFSVVADEVRKLAEQSGESAQQIFQLISTIQEETNKAVQSMENATNEVDEGIEVVNSAGESFEQIQGSVDEVNKRIKEVSSAVQQMSAGADQMVGSMKLISEVAENSASGTQEVSAATEEQMASMEEISFAAESLSKMAEELQTLISKFKV
ncbi:methyl-accepting chemotaxis protein [Psychrobacillus glaciei]|uniref:Methyl-accepting chemotaxis protein n=1 Tax=Psychrobacillus glaciei TaxID=2283160 RepID=A0A5J6SQH3_9BACI|nr:HAMP domain-containing methyl-accepting chemotaxis protein [Psychrobacillus glaciei]QFF98407.1 methyl-accepting chemotaxis protein [Psychrobacillus glaciei]